MVWLASIQTVNAAIFLNGTDITTITSGQAVNISSPVVVTVTGDELTHNGYIYLTFFGEGLRGSCTPYDPSFTFPDNNTRQVESTINFDTWYCDNNDIITSNSQATFFIDALGIDSSIGFLGMSYQNEWLSYPVLSFTNNHTNNIFGTLSFSGVPSQVAAATVATSTNILPLLAAVIAIPLTFWFIMRLIEMFFLRNKQTAARDLYDEKETYKDLKK